MITKINEMKVRKIIFDECQVAILSTPEMFAVTSKGANKTDTDHVQGRERIY